MQAHHTQRYMQLMASKDDVLHEWITHVRQQVPYAADMPLPALVNTLPLFYDHLVALACSEPTSCTPSSIASEHGSQRAQVTRFDAGSIVHEFQLIRAAAFHTWHQAGITLELQEVAQINVAIDEALRDSLSGFSLAEARIREQFFSALTHDLRTPLATAATAVDMIQGCGDPERIDRLAALAGRQHARMAAMIGDLLDMMVSRADSDKSLALEDNELLGLLSEVVSSVALSSGRVIELRGTPVKGLWSAAAVRRAIENLLNNAVKYSYPGTEIGVTLEAVAGHAMVSITNAGPPIPEEQTEAIFQLFRRASRDEERGIPGWGIGLPYVRSVAERHAGSVIVRSSPSHTTFVFDIPVDPRPKPAICSMSRRPLREDNEVDVAVESRPG